MSDPTDHPFFDEPSPEPEPSGVPPWLLPAAIGVVVTLLLVGLVLILTGDDDETSDTVPSLPASTTVPATEPPATEPPTTEPPATEPPATEPPATEPPATEPTRHRTTRHRTTGERRR
jgi:hypothetical protein